MISSFTFGQAINTLIQKTHTLNLKTKQNLCIYLCLQFLALLPDLLYWNLDSDSFIDRWYFFIFTQERPAASNTHQTVSMMLSTTNQLQITIPTHHTYANSVLYLTNKYKHIYQLSSKKEIIFYSVQLELLTKLSYNVSGLNSQKCIEY